MGYQDAVEFGSLLGKTLTDVSVVRGEYSDNNITFTCDDGTKYVMYHEQDCCEGVYIEDICGEMAQIIGEPILMAEEVVSTYDDKERGEANEAVPDGWTPESQWTDSYTWTFYKLRTMHGSVTIRWYGESNGYYSESVDFEKVPDARD